MHRITTWLATALMAALLCALATASFAATPCEKRQLWDREFAYIDKISTTCRLLTTGAVIAAGLYAPYPSIVGELGGRGAATVARYASTNTISADSSARAARCTSNPTQVCGDGSCNTAYAGPAARPARCG